MLSSIFVDRPRLAIVIAIVTTIEPVHLEFFPDGIEGITRAKAEIFSGVEPGGTAIVPFETEI